MSERMIELQRAKLGLLPAGQSPSVANAASPKPSPHATGAAKQQTPEEAAVATMHTEDSQMERFINRLQRRDDGNQALLAGGAEPLEGSHGPTVPTALSRRMLQRQGVGYLDNTVAAVVSASADRFLATVLQQAVACRDQRLKGAAMAREAAKHRKRHMQHYAEDTDDRKRRKEQIDGAREKVALDTISKGEAAKKGGAAAAAAAKAAAAKDGETKKTTTKKKGKKKAEPANGNKLDPATKRLADEEEEEYDSIDEEEEYYQKTISVGDDDDGELDGAAAAAGDVDQEEEEDKDDTLLLKDLVRPLEAWNFHLTGKIELETDGGGEEEALLFEEDDAAHDAGDGDNKTDSQTEDDGGGGKSDSNKDDDDDGDNGDKKSGTS
ncbi:MAG: hypothetical protein SGARI_002474 [Bacillariaceae sp.]